MAPNGTINTLERLPETLGGEFRTVAVVGSERAVGMGG